MEITFFLNRWSSEDFQLDHLAMFVFSVLVNAGLANLLGSFTPTLPSFTLAFNIVTILLFTCLMPRNTRAKSKSEEQLIQQFPVIQLLQDENLHIVGVQKNILGSDQQCFNHLCIFLGCSRDFIINGSSNLINMLIFCKKLSI